MPRCSSNKRGYVTEAMAEDALIEARVRFVNNSAVGVYECQDCGDWHLTSQGSLNPQLQKRLKDGSLDKDRDAMDWERKLRK